MNARHCIGIDVSKATLDACSLSPNGKMRHKQFTNDPAGWSKLLRWAKSLLPSSGHGAATGAEPVQSCHFCLESTGPFSEGLALFLAEAGELVSVENPHRVKHFGIGQGFLNKTDRADARTIALYCQKNSPAPWRLSAPEVRTLVALLRRLDSMKSHLVQEKNRRSEPGLTTEVLRSLRNSIRFLEREIDEREIDRLEGQIRSHIDHNPTLKSDKDLLLSIPGIGEAAAHCILAELPAIDGIETAQAAAAFAGLNPREHRSGTSVNRPARISRKGNSRLRTSLYMPAMCAIRFNPLIKELYGRLIKAGKPPKAALIAAMRKLLMIAYGVLKNRRTFTLSPAEQAA